MSARGALENPSVREGQKFKGVFHIAQVPDIHHSQTVQSVLHLEFVPDWASPDKIIISK